jgi:hypothetical protein
MTPSDSPDVDSLTSGSDTPARRARISTSHDDPAVVAGAVEPDNTDQMTTTVTAGRVVTTIERPATGGLQSTVDDYLVNLQVADAVAGDDAGNTAGRADMHRQTNDSTDDSNTNDT